MRLTIELSNRNELEKVLQLLQSLQIKEVKISPLIDTAPRPTITKGDKSINPKPVTVPQKKKKQQTVMNEVTFWEIIHTLAWEKSGDNEAILQPAVKKLAQYNKTSILAFHDLLSEKLYLLDGKKFADNASNKKSISADLFLYARCFVVASGKAIYYQTLNNASLFPKDIFFDDLLYLPEYAWTLKTGQAFNHLPKYMYETGFNHSGWGDQAIIL